MIERVVELVRRLRAAGVRVSLAEAIEAAEALRHVPIEAREAVRLGLRSALIKQQGDFWVFEQLFGQCFGVGLAPSGQEQRQGEGGAPAELGGQGESATEAKGKAEIEAEGEGEGERPQGQSGEESDEDKTDKGRDQGEPEEENNAAAKEGEAAAKGGEAFGQEQLAKVDLQGELPPGQSQQLEAAVAVLGARLAARQARRYRRTRRGSLDLRGTLQKGNRSGGLPFVLVRRQRKIAKTELVILCDISGSVWNVARFFLQLLHQLQKEFTRVRTYLFVDRITEVTPLFEETDFSQVVRRLEADPTLNLMGRSDYGRALYQFYDEALHTLSRQSALVVLGDGRSNFYDPLEWTLEEMGQRAGRVLWLNPEAPSLWDSYDSVIAKYKPYCDWVLECNTLAQLERAGALLLQPMGLVAEGKG